MARKITLSIVLVVLFAACDMLPTNLQQPSAPPASASNLSISLSIPADGAHLPNHTMVDVTSFVECPGDVRAVNLLVNGAPYRSDVFQDTLHTFTVYQPWTPHAPGTYTLQTSIETHAGRSASASEITVYVDDAPPPIEETTPTDTPQVPETPEEECPQPEATMKSYANCRSGPDERYALVGSFKPDQTALILAKNYGATWWKVAYPTGGSCWIWSNLVTVCGDTADVPTEAVDPLPPQEDDSGSPEAPPEEPPPDPPKDPTKDPGSGPTTPG